MVQIRKVPSEFHRRLTARSASEGRSLFERISREVGTAPERPTLPEVLERRRSRPLRRLKHNAADVIRADRDARSALDASTLVELLVLNTPTGQSVAAHIADPSIPCC